MLFALTLNFVNKIFAYRKTFLLFSTVIFLLTGIAKAQTQLPPCTTPTRMYWLSASVYPVCPNKNGFLSIDLPSEISGAFKITLMYRPEGTNNPLAPYEGGRIVEGVKQAGSKLTFKFDNLGPNYYCVLIQTAQGCFNVDVVLSCCVPTRVQWLEATRYPMCPLKNGYLSLRLGAEVLGQYRVTLMARKNASDPLVPYEGGRIIEGNRLQGDPVQIVEFKNLEPNYYCILIQTYQGCFNVDYELFCTPVPSVCTYTQGAWGSAGGKMRDQNGAVYTTTQLLQTVLAGGGFSVGSNGRFVSITTPQQVLDFLPEGGPSFAFTHSGTIALNNVLSTYGTKKAGSLLAQTITLGLNLRIPEKVMGSDVLGHIPLEGIVDSKIVNALSNKTVRGLYDLANNALGGGTLPAGISLSDISDAVDKINNRFDECRKYDGSSLANNETSRVSATATTSNRFVTVSASPNPFRDKVKFAIDSRTSGQGVLEVYTMAGLKVSTIPLGFIASGKGRVIEYKAPTALASGLLYVFSVNGQQVSGKLVTAR